MSLSTKFSVLLLAAVGVWALTEFDLVSRAPQESTNAALRQFQDSDGAADQLRQDDAAKNAWLVFGPLLIALLAGLLFWDVVVKLIGSSGSSVSPTNREAPKPQGEKS